MGYHVMPTAEELAELYQRQEADDAVAHTAIGGTSEAIAQNLLTCFGWIDSPGRTLEVGPGEGAMTDELTKLRDDIVVLEPFASVDYASKGVVHYSSLDDIPSGQRFKWIFMIEVIEHVADPIVYLRDLGRFLEPQGKIIVTTPNAAGWKARIKKASWKQLLNPTHLNLFGPDALKTVFERAGYRQVHRSRKPMAYKSNFLANALLGIMQITGMDGGLRIVASDWHEQD